MSDLRGGLLREEVMEEEDVPSGFLRSLGVLHGTEYDAFGRHRCLDVMHLEWFSV